MAESPQHTDEDVKAPNIFERAKEEIESVLHSEVLHHQSKETHGLRDDINENTPLNEVKAPNVFERAKEEIEAIVDAIQDKKDSGNANVFDRAKEEIEAIVQSIKDKIESDNHQNRDQHLMTESQVKSSDDYSKISKLAGKIKEGIDSIIHNHKETHGRNDDIDEKTPVEEVKGPSVFERAKEEIEALVQTIRSEKETPQTSQPEKELPPVKEGGLGAMIGISLEKVCSSQKVGLGASIGKGLEKFCQPWNSKKD